MSSVCRKSPNTTRMRIRQLRHSNFRVYGEGVNLHFETKPNRPLVFVGGQNGYGKSTFITSILWCLYGKLMVHVDPHYERMIRNAGGYTKFIAGNCNRSSGADEYFVEVTLEEVELPSLPCRELVIKRTYSLGKENLEILLDGSPNDLVDSLGFELFIQEYILPKEVARFFLFDAERITALAESRGEEERRELGNAYEKVLGVNRFVEIQTQLGAIRERVLGASGDASVKKKLEEYQNRSKEIHDRIQSLIHRNEEIKERLLSIQTERDEKSLELLSLGFVGDSKDIEELQAQESELKRQIAEASSLFKGYLDIAPLLLAPTWLAAVKSEVLKASNQMPKYLLSQIADEAVNWLVARGTDPELTQSLHKHLVEFSQKPEDEVSIPLPDEGERSGWETRLGWLQNWMAQTQHAIKRDRAALKRIQTKLIKLNASGSNEDAASVRGAVQALDRQLQDLLTERAKNDVYAEHAQRELVSLEKQKSELLKAIEVDLRNETKERVLREVGEKLELFVTAFKEQRRVNLERRICDALLQMLHKEHLLDRVEIDFDHTGMDLKLLNSSGSEIAKDDLSMGEKQLYAIALLKALIDESGMSFPVVIDSPLQKLDQEHALTLLETILPRLSDQVFILPIPIKEFSELEYNAVSHRIHSLFLIEHGITSSQIKHCSPVEFFTQKEVIVEA